MSQSDLQDNLLACTLCCFLPVLLFLYELSGYVCFGPLVWWSLRGDAISSTLFNRLTLASLKHTFRPSSLKILSHHLLLKTGTVSLTLVLVLSADEICIGVLIENRWWLSRGRSWLITFFVNCVLKRSAQYPHSHRPINHCPVRPSLLPLFSINFQMNLVDSKGLQFFGVFFFEEKHAIIVGLGSTY